MRMRKQSSVFHTLVLKVTGLSSSTFAANFATAKTVKKLSGLHEGWWAVVCPCLLQTNGGKMLRLPAVVVKLPSLCCTLWFETYSWITILNQFSREFAVSRAQFLQPETTRQLEFCRVQPRWEFFWNCTGEMIMKDIRGTREPITLVTANAGIASLHFFHLRREMYRLYFHFWLAGRDADKRFSSCHPLGAQTRWIHDWWSLTDCC